MLWREHELEKFVFIMWLKFRVGIIVLLLGSGCQTDRNGRRYLESLGLTISDCNDLIVVVNAETCLYCNLGVFELVDSVGKKRRVQVLTNDTTATRGILPNCDLFHSSEVDWLKNAIDVPALGYIKKCNEGIKVTLIDSKSVVSVESMFDCLDSCKQVNR